MIPKKSRTTPSSLMVNQVLYGSLGESRVQERVLKVLGPSRTMEGRSEVLCSNSKVLEGKTWDLDRSRIDPLQSKLFGSIQIKSIK